MQAKRPDSVQQQLSLKPYNSFRFEYVGEYVAKAQTIDELADLLAWANRKQLPITVIGGGSNLLLTDELPGLVIINQLSGVAATKQENSVLLNVAAGENWHQLVQTTVLNGWYGIENLALIPGTAGAAPVQNIGAYGVEVKDCLNRVQVMDLGTQQLLWLDSAQCGFAYRDSNFKGKWAQRYIITEIELKLSIEANFKLEYGGLANHIEGEPSLQKVFDTVCQVRASKLPSPDLLANAGSFFKNPVVDEPTYLALRERFPNMVSFPAKNGYKLAAGWLIDQAGWKGHQYKGVGVYPKQALVLVNYHDSKANHLLELQKQIQTSVYTMYGVTLEREPIRMPALLPLEQGLK